MARGGGCGDGMGDGCLDWAETGSSVGVISLLRPGWSRQGCAPTSAPPLYRSGGAFFFPIHSSSAPFTLPP